MAGKAGRRTGKLTARGVKTARKPGLYGDGNGLYLKVDGASKSWVFRFKLRGKPKLHGLGPTHAVTLADARVGHRRSRAHPCAGVRGPARRGTCTLWRKIEGTPIRTYAPTVKRSRP
jgi:hypothetical protein